MATQALFAWLHFAAVFVTLAALAAELALFRRGLTLDAARLLGRVDAVFGLGAGAVLLTGLARVLWFGKGAWFYAGNPVFWAKMAVFALIALLSIPPTVQFLRWRRTLAEGRPPEVSDATYRRLRALMWLEAGLFLLLPLLAALMARGIGR